jgi:hypothetical protein
MLDNAGQHGMIVDGTYMDAGGVDPKTPAKELFGRKVAPTAAQRAACRRPTHPHGPGKSALGLLTRGTHQA